MADEIEVPFGANEVRLSPREWVVALILSVVALYLIPIVWGWAEPLEIAPDPRVPHSLSEDYWLYERYCRSAGGPDTTLVVGDSVVWGHYVKTDQTLSHYLNESAGREHFVNLGVDGIHPAALAGLIEYYGRAISGKDVILHCNLLWMSSKRHDLQTAKEFAFNHPRLVPQFFPRIPCYRESFGGRLGIVVRRHLAFCGWVEHMQRAHFARRSVLRADDLADWPAFCAALRPSKGAELSAPDAAGASRRIWSLLPEYARSEIVEISREDPIDASQMPPQAAARRARAVRALNAIIGRRDFYRADAFREVDLPAEAKKLLARDRAALSAAKVRRLNRLLLEAAYPQEIAEAQLEPGDLVRWPIEHPYDIPAGAWRWGLPSPNESPSPKPDARPWRDKGGRPFGPPWVELGESFQWACFRRTLGILEGRGNRVFVLVGPFNEHMLKAASRATYGQRKAEVRAWLQDKKIPHYIPAALPSDLYADASHPLGAGYARLAEMLFSNEAFIRFDGRRAGKEMRE